MFAGLQGFLTQSNTCNCMTEGSEGCCRWVDGQTASPVGDLSVVLKSGWSEERRFVSLDPSFSECFCLP